MERPAFRLVLPHRAMLQQRVRGSSPLPTHTPLYRTACNKRRASVSKDTNIELDRRVGERYLFFVISSAFDGGRGNGRVKRSERCTTRRNGIRVARSSGHPSCTPVTTIHEKSTNETRAGERRTYVSPVSSSLPFHTQARVYVR